MHNPVRLRISFIAVLFLLFILPAANAVSVPDYSTTYTITIHDDGTALWKVEYRTPLLTDDDLNSFDNYSRQMNALYLPELRDLMQRSAAQAALGTARDMTVNNFTGNALVQTSPTGKFGVVTYTFVWTHFAKNNGGLSIGDAFVGGMYLARDNTLIIQYPQGYTVTSADPVPDQTSDGLIWYGLRAFGPGEPRVTFAGSGSPLLPVTAGILLSIIAIAGYILYRRNRHIPDPDQHSGPDDHEAPEEPIVHLSEADLISLEEKIIQLLVANHREKFQSEIVKELGMPKSSVSTTLNGLHQRGIIQKVKKGRENLIRLIKENG
jgi:uncharacterized membrane protein